MSLLLAFRVIPVAAAGSAQIVGAFGALSDLGATVLRPEHAPPAPQGRWARTFTTVQALFGRP